MTESVLPVALLAALLATAAPAARGQALAWSGFATLGYAQSDSADRSLRFVDRDGSFDRDSLIALQLDARLTPRLSATLQLKAAPALDHDSRWRLAPSWAFVGWRPADDWLLRAGRLRVPLYLYSESEDLGQSRDLARLPAEMYSLTPTTDFDGLSASRSWALDAAGQRELSADAYAGVAHTSARSWTRDGAAGQVAPGARFLPVRVASTGLVLTLRQPGTLLRAGVHHTKTGPRDGSTIPVAFPYVSLGPGLGYYQVSNALPGPGVNSVREVANLVLTLGAEQQLGPGWRVAAEFARKRQFDTELGSETFGGYVALFKPLDAQWTPYLLLARAGSGGDRLALYRRLITPSLPAAVPGAAQINAAQRLAAESGLWVLDQRSWALGSAYRPGPASAVKLEWMRTHYGGASYAVDPQPGSTDSGPRRIDLLSLNYSRVF